MFEFLEMLNFGQVKEVNGERWVLLTNLWGANWLAVKEESPEANVKLPAEVFLINVLEEKKD